MTRRDTNPFLTITSTGGLLPVPLLERLTTNPDDLKGTRPADYQLLPGKQLRDIINRSWNDLQGVWQSYRTHLDTLPADDPATRTTLDRWVLPLLRELGFDTVHPANNTGTLFVDESALTDGRREWPITHEWGDRVPLHLLGANVPLDRRTPGVHGAANASPHSNVQDFLNASDRHLWAIVTNGRHLRILRDSTSLTRQAYLEFDLHTMFDNDVFVDFTLLWMLTHRTRFEGPTPADCWLETWQNTAHEQGVRALTELQNGVRAAIEAFGTGLLEHPANTDLRAALQSGDLDRQDYYRQLLRLVYRLVFLFVIEDRDLLHPPDTDPAVRRRYTDHYSTARLRDQAYTHGGGRHPDAWQQLNVLFDGIASPDGIPALGLPTLTGGLFDPAWTDALTGTQLTNRRLYTAVRNLGYVRRDNVLNRIDYRNLGAEELGSVYESLLAMHPDIDPDTRTVRLDTAAGNERRTTGAFYTPAALTRFVVDETLSPLIERAVSGRSRDEAEHAILTLTVCDPAMGSAHFLIAAAHRLAKSLATVRTGDLEPDPPAVQSALRDVMSRCIYGVDINPMAVELAKVSLWLECHVAGQPLTFLDHHLRCGNSLLGVHEPSILEWNPDAKTAADQGGIPDAAFKALQGDDRAAATAARNHNKTLRKSGRQAMLSFDTAAVDTSASRLARQSERITAMPDHSVEALTAKQTAWNALESDEGLTLERLRADAYCASFTIVKTERTRAERQQNPWDVFYATSSGQHLSSDNEGVVATQAEADQHRFLHWPLEFPEVVESGGFDAIIGNPPFLNQLQSGTANEGHVRALTQNNYDSMVGAYTDAASVFLALSLDILKDGGHLGLLQPDSILASRDAGSIRKRLSEIATLESIWLAAERVFEASVFVCAIVARKAAAGQIALRRAKGRSFEHYSPLEVTMSEVASLPSWGPLVSELLGVPRAQFSSLGQLQELGHATADFRDQFYGLAPFVTELSGRQLDSTLAPLITTGLIDPHQCLWGRTSTKFNKVRYEQPVVDLTRLSEESDLGSWAAKRLVPKILIATQGKVIEALVDEDGSYLPSVPVITVTPHQPDGLWLLAAVLLSPTVTAWAAEVAVGAALTVDAIKLSANQVQAIPLPARKEEWSRAADALRAAKGAKSEEAWRKGLLESARAMCEAYETPENPALEWWWQRMTKWKG